MSLREHWFLDPEVTYLNHGSFGACPKAVLAYQASLRERLEREPVRFFVHEMERMLDEARRVLAGFVGADPEGLVFVPNATTAANTVFRSLDLGPGDELLVTDHEYNAVRNALERAASLAGARVVVAKVPFPLESPDEIVGAVASRATERTRLCLVDHITSATALVLPVSDIVREMRRRNVPVFIDGAHGPGMVPLDIRSLGPDFYTGNCHKWLCTPKGSAFLWVTEDARERIRPLVISHGANSPRTDRSRYHLEFDWTGSMDPTAYLSIPEAIRFMGSLLPGGWPALMERNRALALAVRRTVCDALKIPLPCPDAMIGAMASFPLPDAPDSTTDGLAGHDPLHQALFERYRIEIPVFSWPAAPKRLIRISAQLYNAPEEYERLARALGELLHGS
jgi:isopenicillin-N epimerase